MCLFRRLAKSTAQGVQLAVSALEARTVFIASFSVAADVIISLMATASPIASYEAATEPTPSLRLHFLAPQLTDSRPQTSTLFTFNALVMSRPRFGGDTLFRHGGEIARPGLTGFSIAGNGAEKWNIVREPNRQDSQTHCVNHSNSADTGSKHLKIGSHRQIISEMELDFSAIVRGDRHADQEVVSQLTVCKCKCK
jgi:hypothetical protein